MKTIAKFTGYDGLRRFLVHITTKMVDTSLKLDSNEINFYIYQVL